jgi:hypothetical protein
MAPIDYDFRFLPVITPAVAIFILQAAALAAYLL